MKAVEPQEVYAGLCGEFRKREIEARADETGVYFTRWPTLHLAIDPIGHPAYLDDPQIVHIDFVFRLNKDMPDSAIYSCASGIETAERSNVADAVSGWMNTVAPPIFSFLHAQAKFDATWCPDGDSYGIAGWDCFAGPYAFRYYRAEALEFLRSHPLVAEIREPLAAALDKTALFHTVALFYAVIKGQTRWRRKDRRAKVRRRRRNAEELSLALRSRQCLHGPPILAMHAARPLS